MGIALVVLGRLSTPKVFGGMGFKSLKAFNMATVDKKTWKLVSNLESFITRSLKAKYFHRNIIMELFDAIISVIFDEVFIV